MHFRLSFLACLLILCPAASGQEPFRFPEGKHAGELGRSCLGQFRRCAQAKGSGARRPDTPTPVRAGRLATTLRELPCRHVK